MIRPYSLLLAILIKSSPMNNEYIIGKAGTYIGKNEIVLLIFMISLVITPKDYCYFYLFQGQNEYMVK